MLTWRHHYERWQGSAATLAEVAERLLPRFGLPEEPRPNERLVRDYVQRGIVGRPERDGKEARFGFRQLVDFLVARALLQDGWPLAKIAELTATAPIDELLRLLPQERPPTAAEDALDRLSRERAREERAALRTMGPPPERLARESLLWRRDMRQGGLVPDSGLPRRDAVRIELTPWCLVVLDRDALDQIDTDIAEVLGRQLTAALLAERLERRRK
ncbi:MAG: hypothetical protein U1E14_21225 [Geminicoccaceae bacterium]